MEKVVEIMSFRNTFITQFIYEDNKEDLNELIDVLKKNFDSVLPSYTDTGYLTHIVMRSRDLDDFSVEHSEIPDMLKEGHGILKGDLDIVAAWECDDTSNPRQRVFTIKGRGDITRLEYIDKQS